jgi:signal transduction histidine kinase
MTHIEPTNIDLWHEQRPTSWKLWVFPAFWGLVFCGGLAASTLALAARHPERLANASGAGLAALLLANFAVYLIVTWGWLYRDQPVPTWRGFAAFGAQLGLLGLLIWLYGAPYAWIGLALCYPVVGGLPARQWPLPIAALLLLFALGSLAVDRDGVPLASAVAGIALQIVVNMGIALVLRLMSTQSDRLRAALRELREAHAELAASADQKQELAVLRERARLARAMHDDLGHALVLMNIKLEAAELLYTRDPARGAAELAATRELIRAAMANLRRALADLRAPLDTPADLGAALSQLAESARARSGLAVACEIVPDLPPATEAAGEVIWYVAREALTNVERHAGATSVTLTVERSDEGWRLRVEDDGAGIRPADLDRPRHYGVVGMRERVSSVGGRLWVGQRAAGGTVVEALLPIAVQEAVAQ